jgi:hypothetical protein
LIKKLTKILSLTIHVTYNLFKDIYEEISQKIQEAWTTGGIQADLGGTETSGAGTGYSFPWQDDNWNTNNNNSDHLFYSYYKMKGY